MFTNLFTLSLVGMPVVENPDDPTNGNPDALVIGGERIEPDDTDVDDGDDYDDDEPGDLGAGPDDDDDVGGRGDNDFQQRLTSAQQALNAERQRANQLQARFDALRNGGVNIEEIEALLRGADGASGGTPVQPNNPNVVTRGDLNRVVQGVQLAMARTAFLSNNQEYKDPSMAKLLNYNIAELINEDRANGVPTRSAEKLFADASKKVKSLIGSFEKKGKQKAGEKRKVVNRQSSDVGGNAGKKAGSNSSDADEVFDPKSAYMTMSKPRVR